MLDERSSSDEMVNIQIEESLMRESLMSIDSANFHEDIATVAFFCIVLGLVIFAGIIGPQQNEITYYNYSIPNDTSFFDIPYKISGINKYNKNIEMYFMIKKRYGVQESLFQLSYRFQIHCLKGTETQLDIHRDPTEALFSIPSNSSESNHTFLFSDRFINYDLANVMIRFDKVPNSIESIVIGVSIGTPEHMFFQIYFRFVFIGLLLFFLVLLLFRLRKLDIKLWHLEQKLTIPLIILVMLYNNPVSIFQIIFPSLVLNIYDIVMTSLFKSYYSFFVLALFDSLRYKNRKTDKCFFLPKAVFTIMMFVVYSLASIMEEISSLPLNGSKANNQIYSNLQTFVYIVYLVWVVISIFVSGYKVDITEKYKFYMYLSCGIVALIFTYGTKILHKWFNFFDHSSLGFVMQYASENVFSLLMAYFHWPYEVFQDQIYTEENSDHATSPNEFLRDENQ